MENMNRSRFRIIQTLTLIAFLAYGSLFIYKTSFVVEGTRYFCLFDDAMISMTYARNLASGNGLVWHPEGERVEGFTNLLWTLYMSLIHLLPLDRSIVSLGAQISGLLFLFINLILVIRISEKIAGKFAPSSLGAMALTAFYLPLNNWGLQGMEVSLITLLLNLAVLMTFTSLECRETSIGSFIVLGIATLVRLDMVAPYLAFFAFHLFQNATNKNRALIAGFLILLFVLIAQTIFRFWYYADFLPNTYYLKMSGVPIKMRIIRGMIVLALFIWKFNWILFFLPLSGVLFMRDRKIALPFLLIVSQLSYSAYAGGDAWEWWGGANRFISIVMPLHFILLSYVLFNVIVRIMSRISVKPSAHQRSGSFVFVILIAAALINTNAIRGPSALGEWLLLESPLHVSDHREKVEEALLIKNITRPEARVAVAWGGVPIYFSERQGVDLLGKNDRRIARLPVREISSFHQFTPGHLKRDYAWSIGELKPDLVAELTRSPEEAKPFLDEAYQIFETGQFQMYILKDSPNILWDEVRKLSADQFVKDYN